MPLSPTANTAQQHSDVTYYHIFNEPKFAQACVVQGFLLEFGR